jgi:hypothetical protein
MGMHKAKAPAVVKSSRRFKGNRAVGFMRELEDQQTRMMRIIVASRKAEFIGLVSGCL